MDGSPHYRDYIAAADERKRRRLKAKGYRIVAIKDIEAGLDELAKAWGIGEVDLSSLGDGRADQDGGSRMRMLSWMLVDMKRRVSLTADSMAFLRSG